MNSEFDNECKDLDSVHGNLLSMECVRPWTNEEYKDTTNPLNISGRYKMKFEDGAEVEVSTIYSYALTHGSFWFRSDSKDVDYGVFVTEPRALAYFAKLGENLQFDKEGECVVPSYDEAQQILWGDNGLNVPYEALAFGSNTAIENKNRWIREWKSRGMIRWNEEENNWVVAR